jgi:hypothetical protein
LDSWLERRLEFQRTTALNVVSTSYSRTCGCSKNEIFEEVQMGGGRSFESLCLVSPGAPVLRYMSD